MIGFKGKKILGIGAHHDDVELNCTGTLLKAKNQGAEISLLTCASGSSITSLKKIREEQEKVSDMMGYQQAWELGLTDGYIDHTPQLVKQLDLVIENINPDYIFTHSETDYHQDHIAVAKAVKSANRFSKVSIISFPSQDIKLPFEANLYVNITDYFDKKVEIIKMFESQLPRPWSAEDTIIARNIGTGIAKYVEKFHIEFLKL